MRKLLQSLGRRMLPAANLEIRLPTGIHIPIGSRDQISTFEEVFLAQSYADLLDQVPLPATVCDLGCNAGYFPLALEDRKLRKGVTLATRYVCVDANAQCLKIARRGLEKNLPAGSWQLIQGCVGEPGQEMSFHQSKADAHSSVIAKYSITHTIKMKALDLQALFQEQFPSGIDLLKVDIEGAERYLVTSWSGTLTQFCRHLMVEYHPYCGLTPLEFSTRLGELGFSPVIFNLEKVGEQVGLFVRKAK